MRKQSTISRYILLLVFVFSISVTARGQLVLRTWVGLSGNQFADSSNWVPPGVPSIKDSLVIGSIGNCVLSESSAAIGSLQILSGGKLTINFPADILVEGPIIVEDSADLQVTASCYAKVRDIYLNGRISVATGSRPRFIVRGRFVMLPTSRFDPGRSNFEFMDSTSLISLPPIEFYDLTLNDGIGVSSTGNMKVYQLELNVPLHLRSGDTLTVTDGDTSSIIGTGRITNGTIVRQIDTAYGNGGGAYRFHTAGNSVRFFRQGILPTSITMKSHPDTFPPNLDTTKVFKQFYDIHQVGGSGFRLDLSLQYGPGAPVPFSVTEQFSIYRSSDDGITWSEIPATSFDTTNRTIRVDSITGFSRYGFGRPSGVTSVKPISSIPLQPALFQNYPNPFNPSTKISYSVRERSMVSLTIHDVLGQEVARLVDAVHQPGTYEIGWNAEHTASGIYFARLQAGTFTVIKKMVILK